MAKRKIRNKMDKEEETDIDVLYSVDMYKGCERDLG